MDKDLDGRFARLEAALANMVDSLAKNNPSEKLAEELVAAEADLHAGLKLLEQHQNNHARIQRLRQETSLLDTQIKDTLSSLWNMRKELKAVPVTVYPPGKAKHPFTADELLGFARRISRNTLPPPGALSSADPSAPSPAPQTSQQQQQQSQPSAQSHPDPDDSFRQTQSAAPTPNTSFNFSFTNGAVGTPNPIAMMTSTPPTTAEPSASQLVAGGASQPSFTTTTQASTILPEHLHPAVDPLRGQAFYPWPTEDRIRAGGLAAIQRLAERGIDPRGYDPAAEERRRQAEEQRRREAEEREREEAERRMREERERIARERERERERQRRQQAEMMAASAGTGAGAPPGLERRESVRVGVGAAAAGAAAEAAAGGGGGRAPQQFTFLGGDDDDEDEDED